MSSVIKIGIIGDHDPGRPSHRATTNALRHSADALGAALEIQWLPTESLENHAEEILRGFDGIFCAPGSPYRSMQGALNAIRYARENGVPFIGTCGGFQHAAIEYARNALGVHGAGHEETDPGADDLAVTALSCSLAGESRKVLLDRESMAYRIYGQTEIVERFSCSYGLNPEFRKRFRESGFRISGADENGEARILELAGHRFFTATLFQPQLSSEAGRPHKLITAFIKSASRSHG